MRFVSTKDKGIELLASSGMPTGIIIRVFPQHDDAWLIYDEHRKETIGFESTLIEAKKAARTYHANKLHGSYLGRQ